MASNQYFEEPVPQVDSLEDKSSLKMLKCASDEAIEDSDKKGFNGFDCNICLDCVQDPVVTLCGHLYCWPCIYKWLNFHSISSDHEEKKEPQCPVCKSEISVSSLVPLYGRDQTTSPSKSKAQQVGIVTPSRPLGPSWVVAFLRYSQLTSQAFHPQHPHHPQQLNSISEDALTRRQVDAEAARANTSLYNDVVEGAGQEIMARLRAAQTKALRLREALELSRQHLREALDLSQRTEVVAQRARAYALTAIADTERAEADAERAEAIARELELLPRRLEL